MYPGNRELRRRASVSSPRNPFSPSLAYRSPLVSLPPSPPSEHPRHQLSKESFAFGRSKRLFGGYRTHTPAPIEYERIASPYLTALRPTRRAVSTLAFLVLWPLTWLMVHRYARQDHTDTSIYSERTIRPDPSRSVLERLAPSVASILTSRIEASDNLTIPLHIKPKSILSEIAYNLVAPTSLSIVLPCPYKNMNSALPTVLYSLSTRYMSVGEPYSTLLVCSRSQSQDAVRIVDNLGRRNVYVHTNHVAEYNIVSSFNESASQLALLHVAAAVTSEWVLVLDEHGVLDLSISTITLLHHPPNSLKVPYGPRGASVSRTRATCISNDGTAPQSAAFLVPPFTVRTSLLAEAEEILDLRTGLGVWAALGQRIIMMTGFQSPQAQSGIGGLVVGADTPAKVLDWCKIVQAQVQPSTGPAYDYRQQQLSAPFYSKANPIEYLFASLNTVSEDVINTGLIVVLLPDIADLRAFAPTICHMSRHGQSLKVLVYGRHSSHPARSFDALECHLHYDTLAPRGAIRNRHESLEDWLGEHAFYSDVIIAAGDDLYAKTAIELAITETVNIGPRIREAAVIWFARDELPYTEWTATLDIRGWHSWHIPQIELIVITNDRPASLARLLRSLSTAVYFGDNVPLHINIEQTADPWTESLVQLFHWANGQVTLRHRVVLGGLLPSVVESWYPSSNDTYGMLLEDDVEVSPMFYAWAKMSLLKYRYGPQAQETQQLFGISLYQQKSIELRPRGREPFSAASLFASAGIPHPFTPYVSQIPCSWGALYFPEHWRMFHSYIVNRLSEQTHQIDTAIISPSNRIRSNRWTRSWKKYFNEMVYLHGYVMLYPNFPNWTALSTNHLEIGVHVRGDVDARDFSRKKAQFSIPLMELPVSKTPESTPGQSAVHEQVDARGVSTVHSKISLLDLPVESLPRWSDLPVVDLWGQLSTEVELSQRGVRRFDELLADYEAHLNQSATTSGHVEEVTSSDDDDDD